MLCMFSFCHIKKVKSILREEKNLEKKNFPPKIEIFFLISLSKVLMISKKIAIDSMLHAISFN